MYEDSPEDVAIDKLFEKCYDGSSLGRPILGTEETLAPITTEIMHKYMHEYYRPEDTVIAVSGHFTDEDLDYIADLFSGHDRARAATRPPRRYTSPRSCSAARRSSRTTCACPFRAYRLSARTALQ